MHHFALLLPLLLFAAPSYSQVGVGDSGSLRPYPGQDPAVRMVQEKIRIEFLKGGSYAVLVDYRFRNVGPESKILMCLPVDNTMVRDDGKNRNLAQLSITIDKRPVAFQRETLSKPETKDFGYNMLWKARVHFKKGQTHHIRVRYHSQTYGSCRDIMTYSLAGRAWRGQVAETSLAVINVAPAAGESVIYLTNLGEHQVQLQKRGNNLYKRWTNWSPDGTFEID